MAKIKFVTAQFFDDIRWEIGPRPSYMGQYLGFIYVNRDLPLVIQRININVIIKWVKHDFVSKEIFLIVIYPNGTEQRMAIPWPPFLDPGLDDTEDYTSQVPVFLTNVDVPLGSAFYVKVEQAGEEFFAGKLRVAEADPVEEPVSEMPVE